MRKNAVRSISTYNSGEGTILVDVQPAGITIQSVFGSLLELESF